MKTAVTSSHRRGKSGLLILRTWLLALTMCCGFAWSGESQKPKAQQRNEQPKAEQIGSEKAPIFVGGEVTIKKDKAEADDDSKERKLKAIADADLVKYTYWIAAFTFALFAAAAIQAGLFVWQLRLIGRGEKQAKQVAEAAKASADASLLALRPWLSCDVEIAGPLTFNGTVNGTTNSAVFHFRFTIKNFGKTPAMNVRNFFPQFNLSSPQHEFSILKLQKLADNNRGLPVRSGGIVIPGGAPIDGDPGRILFPDEVWIDDQQIQIDRRELEKACEDIRPSKYFSPELVVLITYSYPLADTRASTGFVYRIAKNDRTALLMDEDLGSDQLRVSIHDMWGGSAT